MDPFFYDIVHTDAGQAQADQVRAIISADSRLAEHAKPWCSGLPRQSDLYALIAIATPDIATDKACVKRIAHAEAGDFPLLPVVDDVDTYDFANTPLHAFSEVNAKGLNDAAGIASSLLHHGGLQLYEDTGRIFVSYARSDGSMLAHAIRERLQGAMIGTTVDIYAFPGGARIQREIEERIAGADLVVLVDSKGAGGSEWVAEELDIALSERVPVLGVTEKAAQSHFHSVPHVLLGDDGAEAVLTAVRRQLGRKGAFATRVRRTLYCLAQLRNWPIQADASRWTLGTNHRNLLVGSTPDRPAPMDVEKLRAVLSGRRGLLVAGVRQLRPLPLAAINRVGRDDGGEQLVSVTSLAAMASSIPVQVVERPLSGKRIFLSAAMPSDADETLLAKRTLSPFIVCLIQALVQLGATAVFGGHPSVTPLVHEAIDDLIVNTSGAIELHQARRWQASVQLKADVRNGPVFADARWHGHAHEDIAANISALRDGMITATLDAAVFVGGKTEGFKGPRPGIVDEHDRFALVCPTKPAFILGLAGGAARRLLPRGDSRLQRFLHATPDPDIAAALIVAELLGI